VHPSARSDEEDAPSGSPRNTALSARRRHITLTRRKRRELEAQLQFGTPDERERALAALPAVQRTLAALTAQLAEGQQDSRIGEEV
jgi:hypothetical protein